MGTVTSQEIKLALEKKHLKDFFLTECKSGSTWLTPVGEMKILDALAIRKSWTSPCFTGYEVKVSRSDFLRDNKFYRYEEIVNCLYIVCPKGMINRTELPESVGLMYYDPEKKTLTTKKKAIYRKIEYSPDLLLYIIYSRLDSDRYPFFDSKREYFEEYVRQKRNSKDLGRMVSSRMAQENKALIKEIENLNVFKKQYDIHRAIMSVLEKHNVCWWKPDQIAADLDKRLSRACPEDISSIRVTLESCVDRIKRMEKSNETTDL
ncbi:MAG: hypothetical protein IKM73_00280 [Acidaminococcaceae bacterium]|nr:hypothetical protein [Acidaminococcaceae bacterium]